MKKSRAIWGVWLLFAAVYCALTDQVTGYLLLAVSFLLPVVTGLLSLWVCHHLQAQLSMAAYGEKGRPSSGKIMLKNTGILPADRVLCRISCENLLTGEKQLVSLHMAVPAKCCADTDFLLSTGHAGKLRLTLQTISCYDPFGLFCTRIRPKQDVTAVGLIAPQLFSVETQIAYGEVANMDSDEYSMKKAGNDPSETFAIREYQPGDRIRQIHWKLTEKYDELMVRDYGLPIQNTVLLLLETGDLSGDGFPDPDCLDALAEAILSVSAELTGQQIVHSVGWQNHEENVFSCVEIETEEDVNLILPQILGAVPGRDSMSVAEHYMASREQLEFAHMVVFTPAHQNQLAALSGQCILTEVICGSDAFGYDQQDGVAMVGATPERMAETIAYLEI